MACASLPAPSTLPPLPRSIPTPLGPLAVQLVPRLRCGDRDALGCFSGDLRYLAIRDSMPLEVQWVALEHERVHAVFYYAQIRFADEAVEDRIATAVATSRVHDMLTPR